MMIFKTAFAALPAPRGWGLRGAAYFSPRQVRRPAAVLGLACLAAGALGAQCAADPPAKAKTYQVKETYLRADKTGRLAPFFNITVRIAGPKQIRVDSTTADKKSKGAYYIVDGDAEFEYYGDDNNYRKIDPTPDGHQSSQIRYVSSVDLILDPKSLTAEPKAQVSTSHVTVDGRPMTLWSEVLAPVKDHDGVEVVWTQKLWTDEQTGLPYRRMAYSTQNGKTTPALQLDFFDWVLNKPIPKTEFVFAPPAGAKELAVPKLLPAGTTAPNFAAVTPEGKTVHLSDFKGKVVLLDFWATWCGPCQQSMPHLEKVYQQIKAKQVVVLAVCVWDDKKEYDKWVAANLGKKYHFPIAFDPAGQNGPNSIAGALYRVSGIPTQYLIDKDGKVSATIVGYNEGGRQLEDALHRLGVDVKATIKTATAP